MAYLQQILQLMGACFQAIFSKNISPKQQSLLMTTSPYQLNQMMGLPNTNADQFYCVNNIAKIEQILQYYYSKMNGLEKKGLSISPQALKQSISSLENFITEMKDQNSTIHRKFLKDKEEITKFFQGKQIVRNKSFSKKALGQQVHKNNNKPIDCMQCVGYEDIVVLKLLLKYGIVGWGPKQIQICLNKEKLSVVRLKGQSLIKTQVSGFSQNSQKETLKNTKNSSHFSTNSKVSENPQKTLSSYRINEFINIVTLKSSQLVIKIPQANVQATILLADLIFRRNSIVYSDMIPLKTNDDNLEIKGYIAVTAQAFEAHRFEQDYQNIIKQHQMLKKQLLSCQKGEWSQLHQLRNSSASLSQKSLQRQQSAYSEFANQSAQYTIKY